MDDDLGGAQAPRQQQQQHQEQQQQQQQQQAGYEAERRLDPREGRVLRPDTMESPFQAAAQDLRAFSSSSDAPLAAGPSRPPGLSSGSSSRLQVAALQPSPSSPLSPRQLARLGMRTQRSLPSGRSSPTTPRPGSPSLSPGVPLQQVFGYLTPEELAGPAEVRTLLPGVDLRAHGMEDWPQEGNELPVIRTPQGLNLKDALDRLASSDLSREPSFALAGRYVVPNGSPPRAHPFRGATPAGSPLVPVAEAMSPQRSSSPSPPGGRRPASPVGRPARGPAGLSASQTSAAPPEPTPPPSLNSAPLAPALQRGEEGAATEQARRVAEETRAQKRSYMRQQQEQWEEPLPHMVQALLGAMEQHMEESPDLGPGQPGEGETLEAAAGDMDLGSREQRFWTVDGVPGIVPVEELRAASLDAQWRARAAMRMWPMLAPFVPRLLRQEILSSHTSCRVIGDIMTAEDAADKGAGLPVAMKPCVELLPAAVLIADITGFTALTEALSTKGSAGVELLTKCMNGYFSKVIELLLEFDGDIMKFAGDSMIVAFWPSEEEGASPDKGLKAATMRAAACAQQLAEKFGAMKMRPTGEADPVPPEERAKDPVIQAPEGEWFEDFVNRAEGFFVTGPEHLVEVAFRPVAALLQGAAKPVGFAVQRGVRPVGTAVVGTANSLSAAMSRRPASPATSTPVSRAPSITAGPRVSARLRSVRRSLPSIASSAASAAGGEMQRVSSVPETLLSDFERSGSREVKEHEQHQGVQQDGSVAGPQPQPMEGVSGEVAPETTGRRLRPLAHSRSVANGLVHIITQAAAVPVTGIRAGLRRTHSDVETAVQPQDDVVMTAAEVLGGTMPSQPDSNNFRRQLLPVRPPELPHRMEETVSSPQRSVDRTSTAPANVLTRMARSSLSRPSAERSQGTGSVRLLNSPSASAGGSLPVRPGSTSHMESETCPSASGASFASTTFFQPAAAEPKSYGSKPLPPLKARVTEEELQVDPYNVVTVTAAGSGLGQPQPQPTESGPSQSGGHVPLVHPDAADRDAFPWSQRLRKLIKKAKKAPKNLWKLSMNVQPALSPGQPPSSGSLPPSHQFRSSSTISAMSGISNLEDLTALSRRVVLSGVQQPGSSQSPLQSSPVSLAKRSRRRRPFGGAQRGRSSSQGRPSGRVVVEDSRLLLSLKVLVGAGTVCAFHVGGGQQLSLAEAHGITRRWEFFIGDPPSAAASKDEETRQPMEQLAAIEACALPGKAVLSQEVADLLGDACVTDQLPCKAVLLKEVLNRPAGHDEGGPKAEDEDRAGCEASAELATLAALPDAKQGRALQVLRMHLLENVRLRIEAGHIDYVNEVRPCTVLFLGFPSLNRLLDKPGESLAEAANYQLSKVQQAVELVQKKMRQHEGTFVQFRCDEKGFLAICAFGLPGRTHEDGPARGIQAALSIVEGMKKRGGQAVVGVTSGQLFCAMVGSRRRLEYTAFGDAINLSARLMCKAKEGLASVLCDSITQRLAQTKAHYRALEPLHVKGKRLPVDLYAVTPLHLRHPYLQQPPSLEVSGSTGQGAGQQLVHIAEVPRLMSNQLSMLTPAATTVKPMIGRGDVLDSIVGRVQQLVEQHAGGLVLIEGEPGMGKSRLVEELQRSELGGMYDRCNMFAGFGRTEHKSQSFYPWRRIFRDLFVHDKTFGQLFSLRADDPQNHAVVTELGRRLKDLNIDYEAWSYLLADTLDIPLAELPLSPPAIRGQLTPIAPEPNRNGAARMAPAQSHALGGDEGDWVVNVERPRSFAMRLKRPPRPESPDSALAAGSGGSSSGALSSGISPAAATMQPPPPEHEEEPQGQRSWATHDYMSRAVTMRGNLELGGHVGPNQNLATREISGHLKAKKVQELLIAIIAQFAAAYGPLILILEDLHFFDSSSWKLVGAARDELQKDVLIVATCRPILSSLQASLRQLTTKEMLYSKIVSAYSHVLAQPSTLYIVLQPFTVEETRQFISTYLGGAEVGYDIAQLVWEKSNGLPAFIEQLVVYLQLKLNHASSVGLSGPDLVLQAMDLIRATVGINSTITSRIDRLRPEEQLTLKVASVVGLTVYADLLQVAHPQHPTVQQVEAQLQGLAAANFMKQDPEEPITWRFTQVLARDVVYDLIPVGQRRDWHARHAFAMEICKSEWFGMPGWWWRTMKAIEYWEKSADEAIARAAFADALPLLQKAQDLGSLLAEYYGTDEEAVARRLAEMQSDSQLTKLPSGPLARSSVSSLESLHGSLQDMGSAPTAQISMPLVPQIRRIHWERCMAAMCIAAEVSAQSLNQAMLHCLRALVLLGVPMPWDKQYRRRRRWWRCSFDGCFVAGLCCCSVSAAFLRGQQGEADVSKDLVRRVGDEIEMADMTFLSRPGTLLGSMDVPPNLVIRFGQHTSSAYQPEGLSSADLDARPVGAVPAATATDHLEWWRETQLQAASAEAAPAAAASGGHGPAEAGREPTLPGHREGEGVPRAPEAADDSLSPWQGLVDGASQVAALVSPFASASPLGPLQGLGARLSPLPQAAAAAQTQSGDRSAAEAGTVDLVASGSQSAAAPTPVETAEGKVELAPAASTVHNARAYERLPAEDSAAGGLHRQASRVPKSMQVAGSASALDGEDHHQQQAGSNGASAGPASLHPSGALRSQSVPVRWLHNNSSKNIGLAAGPSGSLYEGPAGGGRVTGEEALEAAVVLEILGSVLLMPEHLDLEALRYVMWACKWLEGKRVSKSSLFYYTWLDCANALHHQRRQSLPGIFNLRPLASLVGNVATLRTARTGSGKAGGWLKKVFKGFAAPTTPGGATQPT
ncbi:hypothetical protein N2152v2_009109 [Parachlorella kessleri]